MRPGWLQRVGAKLENRVSGTEVSGLTAGMNALLLLAPLPDFLLHPLRAAYVCHDGVTDLEATLARAAGSIRGVVLAGGTVVPEALLERLPALEILSVFGVGYDGVPIEYCRRRGLRVTNTPEVLTDDVADLAVALVLMTSRRLAEAERFVRSGEWLAGPFPLGHALRGKTAGIFGLGRIGAAIARRLTAHGLRIAYHGRRRQAVEHAYCPTLLELAEVSDFLVVACPGGGETRHAVNAQVLMALGPNGTLINIARGSVVDEAALVRALAAGAIRAAGLDVFENEPQVPVDLLASPRVVLLPHVGSATKETRAAMAGLVVENLVAHFAGRSLPTPVL